MDRRLFLGAGIAGAGWLAFGSAWSQQGTPNFGACARTWPRPAKSRTMSTTS